jgi:hypothetical protein
LRATRLSAALRHTHPRLKAEDVLAVDTEFSLIRSDDFFAANALWGFNCALGVGGVGERGTIHGNKRRQLVLIGFIVGHRILRRLT